MGPEAEYFDALAAALDRAAIGEPVLVIDRGRLEANRRVVQGALEAAGLALRLVVKSLPAHDLIDAILGPGDGGRLMVFNGPMLTEMRRARPRADILMGKPLSDAAMAALIGGDTPGAPGTQWLVDTPERLEALARIASAANRTARVSFEIDVGLRRGGLEGPRALAEALDRLNGFKHLSLAGLMGYDPHVARTPAILGWRDGAFRRAQARFAACRALLVERLGAEAVARLTLNGAGSPTYALHATRGTAANDIAVGSAFVKPTDFDLDTLAAHRPAAFIASPVLKSPGPVRIPELGAIARLRGLARPRRAVFIHGGHWLADPVHPPDLGHDRLYGLSSNQEMLTAPAGRPIRPGTWVFLRPRQSEAVFLQFGAIAVFDGRGIAGRWPVFPASA